MSKPLSMQLDDLRDDYNRAVTVNGYLNEELMDAKEALDETRTVLKELFDYVGELEQMHGVAVAVRGGRFPDGAEGLGDKVRAALASFVQHDQQEGGE